MNGLIVIIALGATMGGWHGAWQGEQSPDAVVIGTWEGESKCTVAGSACRDEHVIYEIARDGSEGGEKIEAYKVVDGQKVFMGSLQCKYHVEKKNLSCSGGNPQKKGDWEFFVSGDTMQGTLVIGEGRTLYRKVSVKRKGGKN